MVNIFNANLNSADSEFQTYDPKISTSNSPTRYRYATTANDITECFLNIKRRYIRLTSSK